MYVCRLVCGLVFGGFNFIYDAVINNPARLARRRRRRRRRGTTGTTRAGVTVKCGRRQAWKTGYERRKEKEETKKEEEEDEEEEGWLKQASGDEQLHEEERGGSGNGSGSGGVCVWTGMQCTSAVTHGGLLAPAHAINKPRRSGATQGTDKNAHTLHWRSGHTHHANAR